MSHDLLPLARENPRACEFRITLELTWPIDPAELVGLYPGDIHTDFALRSFEARVRGPLEEMRRKLWVDRLGSAHYQLLSPPHLIGA